MSVTGGAMYLNYVERVDDAMLSLGGVKYSELIEMAPDIDRGQRIVQTAAARGLEPSFTASVIIQMHNLARVEGTPVGYAEEFNRRRGAIAGFAASPPEPGYEHGEWSMCCDGRAYCEMPDGQLLRLEVANRADLWGFVVSGSIGAVSLAKAVDDPLRRLAAPPTDTPFERLASGSDIGDAVSRAFEMTAKPPATPGT